MVTKSCAAVMTATIFSNLLMVPPPLERGSRQPTARANYKAHVIDLQGDVHFFYSLQKISSSIIIFTARKMPRAFARLMCLSGGLAPYMCCGFKLRLSYMPAILIGTQAAVPLMARSIIPVVATVLIINQKMRFFISVTPFLGGFLF